MSMTPITAHVLGVAAVGLLGRLCRRLGLLTGAVALGLLLAAPVLGPITVVYGFFALGFALVAYPFGKAVERSRATRTVDDATTFRPPLPPR